MSFCAYVFLYTIILTLMHTSDSDVEDKVVDSRLRVIIPACTCIKKFWTCTSLVPWPRPQERKRLWAISWLCIIVECLRIKACLHTELLCITSWCDILSRGLYWNEYCCSMQEWCKMILQLLLTNPFHLLYSTPYPFFTWRISTLSKSVMEDLMYVHKSLCHLLWLWLSSHLV